jgi:hypothetical protein
MSSKLNIKAARIRILSKVDRHFILLYNEYRKADRCLRMVNRRQLRLNQSSIYTRRVEYEGTVIERIKKG